MEPRTDSVSPEPGPRIDTPPENDPSSESSRSHSRVRESHHVRFGSIESPHHDQQHQRQNLNSSRDRPRPAVPVLSFGGPSTAGIDPSQDITEPSGRLPQLQEDYATAREVSHNKARSSALRLSKSLGYKSKSAPVSKEPTPRQSPPTSPELSPTEHLDMDGAIRLARMKRKREYGVELEPDDDEEELDMLDIAQKQEEELDVLEIAQKQEEGLISKDDDNKTTRPIVGNLPRGLRWLSKLGDFSREMAESRAPSPVLTSSSHPDLERAKGVKKRDGILSNLLSLERGTVNKALFDGSSRRSSIEPLTHGAGSSPPSSGYTTPNHSQKRRIPDWRSPSPGPTSHSIGSLVGSSASLAQPATPRSHSATDLYTLGNSRKADKKNRDKIKFHIRDTVFRQRYLIKICRALMKYGAPSHRLEEYMSKSAYTLGIDGQFLYMPNCMIISFDDPQTHTTEVKLVKETQGVDLHKLKELHRIYKAVIHDKYGVDEAMTDLDALWEREPLYPPWIRVAFSGLACACVAPFAFDAGLIDIPVAGFLGVIVGVLQYVLAPRSPVYSHVFEITATVVTSFVARAMGSINGGANFCFGALAQSSIALILPGFTILCSSLELQSRNIVPGSIRMVYAIIYSLFLGFGITVGTALYGLVSKDATSSTVCHSGFSTYTKWAFVPPFTIFLVLLNQGHIRQCPTMVFIAFAGFVVNAISAPVFPNNAQISNMLGALTIGVLGNMYSRFLKGMSAVALLPAIFVQVPSGLSASGSLLTGIATADQIVNRTGVVTSDGSTTIGNVTEAATSGSTGIAANTVLFNVGYSMIQIAIGLTVGLFLSTLILYPRGRKRGGLFTF